MKGWYGNKQAHSLASRGIRIKDIKDIIKFPEVIDYLNPEEIIVGFWIANIKNDYSNFNFDKAFDNAECMLQYQAEMVFDDYPDITPEDVVYCYENNIEMKSIYGEYGIFIRDYNMAKLYLKVKDRPIKLIDKIILMDEIIHLEHATGSIFWDDKEDSWLDIDQIRDDFDITIKKMGVNYVKRLVW